MNLCTLKSSVRSTGSSPSQIVWLSVYLVFFHWIGRVRRDAEWPSAGNGSGSLWCVLTSGHPSPCLLLSNLPLHYRSEPRHCSAVLGKFHTAAKRGVGRGGGAGGMGGRDGTRIWFCERNKGWCEKRIFNTLDDAEALCVRYERGCVYICSYE